MMGTRLIVVVLGLGACQAAPPSLDHDLARSTPAARSCKPEAPIAVEIASRSVGAGVLEITARATPTAGVPGVELRLALPAHATVLGGTTGARFGATDTATSRTLTARIRVDGRTAEVTAIARVTVGDVAMSRTATVAIGAPAPAPRTRAYTLPDGELAREVRP